MIEEAESSFNLVHHQNRSSPNKVLDVLDDVIKQHDDEMMESSADDDYESESRNLVESDLEDEETQSSKDNDTINENEVRLFLFLVIVFRFDGKNIVGSGLVYSIFINYFSGRRRLGNGNDKFVSKQ